MTSAIVISVVGLLNLAATAWIARHACKSVQKAEQALRHLIASEGDSTRSNIGNLAESLAMSLSEQKESLEGSISASGQSILDAFQPHAEKLHATVEDLRTSARTMHDQAQARAIAPRVVPGRG